MSETSNLIAGHGRPHTRDAQPRAVFAQQLETEVVHIFGHELSAVPHELSDVSRLAAGRGAKVEDGLARSRAQFTNRQQGARVLNVKESRLKTWQAGQRGMRLQFKYQIFLQPVAADKIVFDIFVAPLLKQLAGFSAQRVDTGERFRRRIVPFEQLPQLFSTPPFLPAFAEPVGVGTAEGRLVCFQLVEELFCLATFAGITAQEGVDETGLRAAAE